MADECCQKKANELANMSKRQSKVLWTVLGVNAVMFVVEFLSGLRSNGLLLTFIFAKSAGRVLSQSWRELVKA